MELFDDGYEFRPIDEDRAKFIFELAEDVRRIGSDRLGSDIDGQILTVAANNILTLLAMCMAGYDLYIEHREVAHALRDDILTIVDETMLSDDYAALRTKIPTNGLSAFNKLTESIENFSNDE